MMHYLTLIALLLFVYLEISSNFELGNLVLGLFIAAGITFLLRPKRGPVQWGSLPSSIWALVKYLAILVSDLIKSGIKVAIIVLNPKIRLRQGIVAISAESEADLVTALSAHAITLTPGQLVVEMDEKGVMYTHCLDTTDTEKNVAAEQHMRRDLLDKIFQ